MDETPLTSRVSFSVALNYSPRSIAPRGSRLFNVPVSSRKLRSLGVERTKWSQKTSLLIELPLSVETYSVLNFQIVSNLKT